MKDKRKKMIKSCFESLAILAGIKIQRGWILRLSEEIGIEKQGLYNWINRGNIPRFIVEQIEKQGYPREKWLIPEAEPWHARKGREAEAGIPLQRVAAMYERLTGTLNGLGIPVERAIFEAGVHRWEPSEHYFLGAPPDPRSLLKICDRFGINPDWVWSGEGDPRAGGTRPIPYEQAPEKIIGRPDAGGEVRPGSYGIPDFDGMAVTRVIGQSTDEILQKAREILESEEAAVAEALRANICQFHRLITERRRIKDLEEEVARTKEASLQRIRALEKSLEDVQETLRREEESGGSSAGTPAGAANDV